MTQSKTSEITLDDVFYEDESNDVKSITISIDPSVYYGNTNDSITIDTTTFGQFNTIDTTFVPPTYAPFVDVMPSLNTIKNMCIEYPALDKAFEKFKNIYNLCDQDYKGKIKAGELDDDIPF